MQIPTELVALVDFMTSTLTFFLPSLLGSAVSYYVRKKPTTSGKKKHRARTAIKSIVIYAITPAVILSTLHLLVIREGPGLTALLCISVLTGAVGEDVTKFFLNIRNTLYVFKAISGSVGNLKKVAEALEAAEQAMEDEEKEGDSSDDINDTS